MGSWGSRLGFLQAFASSAFLRPTPFPFPASKRSAGRGPKKKTKTHVSKFLPP